MQGLLDVSDIWRRILLIGPMKKKLYLKNHVY